MMQLPGPYKKARHTTSLIMLDVIIALLPLVIVAYLAFGNRSLMVIGTSVSSCLIAEMIFTPIFLKQRFSVTDGSAIITGLLLAFTLSPLTPWYVVAFGGAMAVLAGKILWGGVGKNKFNPALVGRECMVAFFATVMNAGEVWNTKLFIELPRFSVSNEILSQPLSVYLNGLLYNPSGALGEYSVLLLVAGGLYLVIRKRISWHIPVMSLLAFFLLSWIIPGTEQLKYSLGGLLLGIVFMATDMPSSPSHNPGKIFYGVFLGLVVMILLKAGVSFAYMSYGILIMNGFTVRINEWLRPVPWGHKLDLKIRLEHIFLLSLSILAVTLAVISLHYYGFTNWLVYVFIIYMLLKYYYIHQFKISNPV